MHSWSAPPLRQSLTIWPKLSQISPSSYLSLPGAGGTGGITPSFGATFTINPIRSFPPPHEICEFGNQTGKLSSRSSTNEVQKELRKGWATERQEDNMEGRPVVEAVHFPLTVPRSHHSPGGCTNPQMELGIRTISQGPLGKSLPLPLPPVWNEEPNPSLSFPPPLSHLT